MATIYATNDGRVINFETTNWTDTRDATSGNTAIVATGGTTFSSEACRVSAVAGRGGTTYAISRGFFQFNTTHITHVPKSATFLVYGYYYGAVGGMYGVKSIHDASLSTNDFDAIEGWQTGGVDNSSNLINYTNIVSSWDTSGYNTFTLNQQALVDIAGTTEFKIAILNNTNDVRGAEPSGNYRTGWYFPNYIGTSLDPKLVIVEQDNSVFFGTNF